ncbi:hypothetical protein ACTMTU_28430 [Streptomyces sp. OZ13]|uniref:hypothetical protein n=1 Tax=Streptomyces sp. OZ13 TaxID=3452210 RepID=UPI003F8C0AD7
MTTETDVAPTCCSDANVAEQIDSIEDVVGWNFTDTRERLAALLDAEEERTPTSPRRAPAVLPRHTPATAPPADATASVAALFRSLDASSTPGKA